MPDENGLQRAYKQSRYPTKFRWKVWRMHFCSSIQNWQGEMNNDQSNSGQLVLKRLPENDFELAGDGIAVKAYRHPLNA